MKVDFYRHSLGDEEFQSILRTLGSSFLTAGPKTAEFEREFAAYLGVPYAVGLTSCTAALFLALKAFGVGEGDEVIVPAMTFIATSNVVLHCGAKPVFVDVEAATGLIAVDQVKRAITGKTKAIMPVHLYGQMADMKALREVADRHQLVLIEDAAHAVESVRDGAKPGSVGDAAAFSFYATKNITSGEGGALSLRDSAAHEKVRLLRQHGMSKSAAERYHGAYQHWDMLELGYKYNMFDLQAALLLPQLAKIEERLARREAICRKYEERFRAAGIEFPQIQPGARSARHLFTFWAPLGRRDEVLARLQQKQVGVAVNYRAPHLLTYYRRHFGFEPGAFPNAERIGDRTITVPLYPGLSDAEVEYVIESVIEAIR